MKSRTYLSVSYLSSKIVLNVLAMTWRKCNSWFAIGKTKTKIQITYVLHKAKGKMPTSTGKREDGF